MGHHSILPSTIQSWFIQPTHCEYCFQKKIEDQNKGATRVRGEFIIFTRNLASKNEYCIPGTIGKMELPNAFFGDLKIIHQVEIYDFSADGSYEYRYTSIVHKPHAKIYRGTCQTYIEHIIEEL